VKLVTTKKSMITNFFFHLSLLLLFLDPGSEIRDPGLTSRIRNTERYGIGTFSADKSAFWIEKGVFQKKDDLFNVHTIPLNFGRGLQTQALPIILLFWIFPDSIGQNFSGSDWISVRIHYIVCTV
jgi:hypothetical protein